MAEKMRVFHVTKRAEDGQWTVKEEKTDDVLHTFDTREDATRYCEVFAEEKDALIKYPKDLNLFSNNSKCLSDNVLEIVFRPL